MTIGQEKAKLAKEASNFYNMASRHEKRGEHGLASECRKQAEKRVAKIENINSILESFKKG